MSLTYISKSSIAASKCETFFMNAYLSGYKGPAIVSPPAVTGSQVHAFMAALINHLSEVDQGSDPEWVARYIKETPLTDDAVNLIQRTAEAFHIDPRETVGTECFLSVDQAGQPVERKLDAVPGYRPDPSSPARFGGTLDWVRATSPDTIAICDFKTTYTVSSVSETESAMYALLVFAHFPQIEHVDFSWWFVRLFEAKSVCYDRSDVPALWEGVNRAYVQIQDITRRHEAGERLTVNPMSGLCPFCQISCPLSQEIQSHATTGKAIDVVVPPIQTEVAAKAIAQRLYIARLFSDRAESALRTYIDANGPIDLGLGYTASVDTQTCRQMPLKSTLDVLGLSLRRICPTCRGYGTIVSNDTKSGPVAMKTCTDCSGTGVHPAGDYSPVWDVPLERLTVGGLSGFAKAKKREGMKEALADVGRTSYKTVLRIRRAGEIPLVGTEED